MYTLAKDIKELARLYKANALARYNKGCSKKDASNESHDMMNVIYYLQI